MIIAAMILLSALLANAQPRPDTLWTRLNVSDTVSIQVFDCTSNEYGDLFIVGQTYNSSNGRGTGLIQKRSTSGDLLWNHNNLTEDMAYYQTVLPTEDGGCIGAGYDSDPVVPIRSYAEKLSATGETEWITYLTPPADFIFGTANAKITSAPDGFYLGVTGYDSTYFDTYVVAARFNFSGDSLWMRAFNPTGLDEHVIQSRTVNDELHLAIQTFAGDLPLNFGFMRMSSSGDSIDFDEYDGRYTSVFGFTSNAETGAAFLLRHYDVQTESHSNRLMLASPDGQELSRVVLPWPVYSDTVTYYFGDMESSPYGGFVATGMKAIYQPDQSVIASHVLVGISAEGDSLWTSEPLACPDRYSDVVNCAVHALPDSSYLLVADRGYSGFPDPPISSIVIRTGPDRGGACISGFVRNQRNNTPVAGVTIRTTDSEFITVTDISGVYSLCLPSGSYDLAFEKDGYCDTLISGVEVFAGLDITLNCTIGAPNFLCNTTSINAQWAGTELAYPILIANANGTCPLEYEFKEDLPWITVSQPRGTIIPNDAESIEIAVGQPAPPPGEYLETIVVRHNAEELTHEIVVNLIVPLAAGDVSIPTSTALFAAYPNPFNATTLLSFDVAQAGRVSLFVYDIQGRLVTTLVDGQLEAGSYTREFRSIGIASGLYFAVLYTAAGVKTQKLMLLK